MQKKTFLEKREEKMVKTENEGKIFAHNNKNIYIYH